MCLAVPGRVVEIQGEGDLRMARVDFGGVVRQACLAYVPEAELGDYVLVHVGFAISAHRRAGGAGDPRGPRGRSGS